MRGALTRSQRCLQVLNIAVYRLLGEKGVYYGSKLGKKVLACTQIWGLEPYTHQGCTLHLDGVFPCAQQKRDNGRLLLSIAAQYKSAQLSE